MKDTNLPSEGWKPGKQGVNFALTGEVAEWLRTCVEEMTKAWVDADTPQQMLNLLETAGWTPNVANTKYATFDNRTCTFTVNSKKQIRFSATYDNKGNMSWAIREWWQ